MILLRCDVCNEISTTDMTSFLTVTEHDAQLDHHYCGWDHLLTAAGSVVAPVTIPSFGDDDD